MAEIAIGAAVGAALGAGSSYAMSGRVSPMSVLMGAGTGAAGGWMFGGSGMSAAQESALSAITSSSSSGTGSLAAVMGGAGSGVASGAAGSSFGLGNAALAGLSLAGSAASSFGGYSSAMDRSGYDSYNAQVAANNAALARGTAGYNASVIETQRLQDRRVADAQFKKDQARREVLMGKGGVATDSGSPLEVLAGAEADHEFNLLTIDFTRGLQKDQAVFQGDQQAFNYAAQASLLENRSGDESESALWSLGGGLLSGGAKAYQVYRGRA